MRYRAHRLEQFHRRLEAKTKLALVPMTPKPIAEDLATLDKMIETAPEGSVLRGRLIAERAKLAASQKEAA